MSISAHLLLARNIDQWFNRPFFSLDTSNPAFQNTVSSRRNFHFLTWRRIDRHIFPSPPSAFFAPRKRIRQALTTRFSSVLIRIFLHYERVTRPHIMISLQSNQSCSQNSVKVFISPILIRTFQLLEANFRDHVKDTRANLMSSLLCEFFLFLLFGGVDVTVSQFHED